MCLLPCTPILRTLGLPPTSQLSIPSLKQGNITIIDHQLSSSKVNIIFLRDLRQSFFPCQNMHTRTYYYCKGHQDPFLATSCHHQSAGSGSDGKLLYLVWSMLISHKLLSRLILLGHVVECSLFCLVRLNWFTLSHTHFLTFLDNLILVNTFSSDI